MNKQHGFTLLEVVLAGFIMSILAVVIGAMGYYFTRTFDFSLEQTQSLSQAQYGIRAMTHEIREARDSLYGSYAMVTVDDEELVIYSNVDDDEEPERVRYFVVGNQMIKQVFNPLLDGSGYVCQDGCDICHDGETMSISESDWPSHYEHGDEVGACGSSYAPEESERAYETIIASNLVDTGTAVFEYYNGSWPGDEASNPLVLGQRRLNTRYIGIYIAVQTQTGTMSPEPVEIRTAVQLRNLKDNL